MIRTTTMQTCDRCEKPFNEEHIKEGQDLPEFEQQGVVLHKTRGSNRSEDHKVVGVYTFKDLCPNCLKMVNTLVEKLVGVDKPKKRRRKKAEVVTSDVSSVDEYSESASETSSGTEVTSEVASEVQTPEGAETKGGDVGSEAVLDDESIIEDPETGDRIDTRTGEILSYGNKRGDAPF